MQIFKQFSVKTASRLPNLPEGQNCAQLYARLFETLIYLQGPVGNCLKPAFPEPHAVPTEKAITGCFVNHG